MKKASLHLLVAVSFCLCQSSGLAQQQAQDYYRAPSSFAGKTVVLPIGTTFEGKIQSTIGSRQSRSGDSFSVEISAPIMANGTEVLIPSGSEVKGEVAEAISSSSQSHDKGTYAPMGRLRVQLTQLKLPDGMTYPLVASFAADGSRGHQGGMTTRKSSVAYVGTQAGFDAVNPALQPRNTRQNGGKMQVLSRGTILSDPILGDAGGSQTNTNGQVRALIRKGRDLYIMAGSTMTMRLDGPLKISFGTSSAEHSIQSSAPDEPVSSSGGKHFAKSRPAAAPQSAQNPPQEGGNMGGQQGDGNPQQGGGNQPGGYPPQADAGQAMGQTAPAQQQQQQQQQQPGSSF